MQPMEASTCHGVPTFSHSDAVPTYRLYFAGSRQHELHDAKHAANAAHADYAAHAAYAVHAIPHDANVHAHGACAARSFL